MKPTQKANKTTQEPNNKPAYNHRLSNVSMAEWRNERTLEDGSILEVSTFTINKSYKDKETGEWKHTNNLSETDLYKLHRLLAAVLTDRDARAIYNRDTEE